MHEFDQLVQLMKALRGRRGCPWDKRQTLRSLASNLIEEAYEASDAISRRNIKLLREELGDLLYVIIFLARICEEKGKFDIRDILNAAYKKLRGRHPHVFEARKYKKKLTPNEVIDRWHRLKHKERPMRTLLDEIPGALPALMKALKVQRRAAAFGFDWREPKEVMLKVEEELGELKRELRIRGGKRNARVKEEMGDLFFALVNLARLLGLDAEGTLDAAVRKFSRRFRIIEKTLKARGVPLEKATLEEMDAIWSTAKAQNRKGAKLP